MIYPSENEELKCGAVMINVNKEVHDQGMAWCLTDENDTVLFRDVDKPNILYILAHGDKDGRIYFENQWWNTGRWLIKNVDDLKAKGIDTVLTIACYGGKQNTYTCKGVLIASIHGGVYKVYITMYKGVSFRTPTSDGIVTEAESYGIKVSLGTPEDGPFTRSYKNMMTNFKNWRERNFPKKPIAIEELDLTK